MFKSPWSLVVLGGFLGGASLSIRALNGNGIVAAAIGVVALLLICGAMARILWEIS